MVARSLAVIHYEPQIPWHAPFAATFSEGLRNLGIPHEISQSRCRESDVAILLGTTLWRGIERTGRYLLVDRCSFGDTNRYVSLVWDGHGRRGNHCVPEHYDDSRWKKHGVKLLPWREGSRRILAGQTESYSPTWKRLEDWYESHSEATHFRPHPQGDKWKLPCADTFADCGELITLNSSVAIEGLIHGRRVVVDDEGGMAYGWSSRLQLMHWLAWTQWSHDEIAEGKPIAHLFDQALA